MGASWPTRGRGALLLYPCIAVMMPGLVLSFFVGTPFM
jgi:hypothetical protein